MTIGKLQRSVAASMRAFLKRNSAVRAALALSTGSGTSVTWWSLREADFQPIKIVEDAVAWVRLTPDGLVGPRGSKRPIGSHLLHFAVTGAAVRFCLQGTSWFLTGAITAGSLVAPALTPSGLLNRAVEASVTVSDEDANAIADSASDVLLGLHLDVRDWIT